MQSQNNFMENKHNGWISIYRSIQKHWIWKDANKLKWWIDLLLLVNHEDITVRVNIGKDIFDCKKGQTLMSLKNLADRWKIDRNKARNFLTLLSKDNMIIQENLIKTTRITICNYDDYQDKENRFKTDSKQTQNRFKTDSDINNNENNENNVNKDNNSVKEIIKEKFIPPTLEQVQNYITEKGITSIDPESFIRFYENKGWMYGKKPVKDWKACIRTWLINNNEKIHTEKEINEMHWIQRRIYQSCPRIKKSFKEEMTTEECLAIQKKYNDYTIFEALKKLEASDSISNIDKTIKIVYKLETQCQHFLKNFPEAKNNLKKYA